MAGNSNDNTQKPKVIAAYEYDHLTQLTRDLKDDPDKFEKHGHAGDVLVSIYEEFIKGEDVLLGENVVLDTPHAKTLEIDRGFFKKAFTSAQNVELKGVLGLEEVQATKAVTLALSDLSNLEKVKVGSPLASFVYDPETVAKFDLQTDPDAPVASPMLAIAEHYKNNSADMKHVGTEANMVAASSTKPLFKK